MVARKEAVTHTYTPELRRGQGPVSQKHTLTRLSTAAAVRAGACRVVAAAVCIAFEGTLYRRLGTSGRIIIKDRPPPVIQFHERPHLDRSPLGSCAQLVPRDDAAVCRGRSLER